MMKKYIKYIFIFVLIAGAGVMYSCRDDSESEIKVQKITSSTADDVEQDDILEETTDELICVHITGYVANQGVYMLSKGCRMYEAIEAAGGFMPEADKEYLNLAEVLSDGQKIHVLSKTEAETVSQSEDNYNVESGSKGKININTASKDELMKLSGIGESRANSIISYREKNGVFVDIEDIMKVSGIKEAAFEKIKDDICTR